MNVPHPSHGHIGRSNVSLNHLFNVNREEFTEPTSSYVSCETAAWL